MGELRLDSIGLEERGGVTADVIFVHGLGGSNADTWKSDGASTFWPSWLFEDITGIKVWALQYPADTFAWSTSSGNMVLPDRARSIIDLLVSSAIGSRPLIFIAYSLGGLVVKQVLRLCCELQKPDWKELAANTRGVLFLATPHSGSGLASLGKLVSSLGISAVVTGLDANNPYLRELNDWYRQNSRILGFKTHAYFEMSKTHGVLIVDQSSANPGIEGCVPIPFDGNHLEICAPTTRMAPIYIGTRAFVESIVAQPSDAHHEGENESTEPTNGVATRGLSPSVPPAVAQGEEQLSPDTLAEFEFFTEQVDVDERLDLAEKLRRGNRTHEIQRALRLKEQFAKRFTRNQLQASVTRRYINVLAEVESRFNTHVYPQIVEGASRADVADLIRQKVTDPILAGHTDADNSINAVVIDRMIYYLTGLCHIRWAP